MYDFNVIFSPHLFPLSFTSELFTYLHITYVLHRQFTCHSTKVQQEITTLVLDLCIIVGL